MSDNKSGFTITDVTAGWDRADFNDVFINKDCFVEGNLFMWGRGSNGTIGNNNIINQSSPVQTISSGANWKHITIGTSHVLALKTDGTLWGWGNGNSGTLATNSAVNCITSSPIQTVSGGTNWRSVSAGNGSSVALKTDGTLWSWGSNTGNNTSLSVSSPVQTVSGGTNWKQISSAGHTSAIKTDGTLWLWGPNLAGQLGNNKILNESSPVQTVSSGTNWKHVSSGGLMTVAIKTDGTLWTWGCGQAGRLGDDNIISRSSPVQTVSGGTTWLKSSVGGTHAAAIKIDGTLWLWGAGVFGQLGTQSTIDISSPVQTVSGGTNWREISLATWSSAGIKTDGTLWTWGSNSYGRLGLGLIGTDYSSPVQVGINETCWRQVSTKNTFGAIKTQP